MNLEIYQQLCAESKILWTQHCLQRMQERDISRADVKKWNCNRRNHRGLSRYKEI